MKPCNSCGSAIGRGRDLCPDCRGSSSSSRTAETTDYDPRFERAQTVEGAKARYVSDDLPDYGIDMLEADVARVLEQGENPDRRDRPPRFEGQVVIGDGGPEQEPLLGGTRVRK